MRSVAGFLLLATSICAQSVHIPPPPAVDIHPVVDDYFGTRVVDNYRWLEDAASDQTHAYIDAQNAYTERYFKQVRMLPDVVEDLHGLEDVTRMSLPIERNGLLFFRKRPAGEEQDSLWMRQASADKRLVDPLQLTRDPASSVELNDVSRDASLIAFGLRQGGADETTVRFYDVQHQRLLEDQLPAGLYRSVAFAPSAHSIYYARQTRAGTLVYEHTLGTPAAHDVLLFGHEFHGELLGPADMIGVSVSDDGRYLILHIRRGVPAHRVDVVFRDLTSKQTWFADLVWGLEARFTARWADGRWLVQTDYQAPNGRILIGDPGILPDVWKTVLPESAAPIDSFNVVGHRLAVRRLAGGLARLDLFTIDGKPAGSVVPPGIGTVGNLAGHSGDRYGYFSNESFALPPTIYRYDTLSGQQTIFFQPKVPIVASDYDVEQVRFRSADGTEIPLLIAGRKGLKRDGSERLLMTGYGGFSVAELPVFNPQWAWWLEQGGWLAVVQLRGGNEFGEEWHRQAMFSKKQNVFDDWFAAAHYLIDNHYTSPHRLAITGRSNGGLLMGAAITQHPELFGAVVCGYPLLDMLRFQRFLQGPQWVAEYGSADHAEQFSYLYRYSPYQNVQSGKPYPAVLFWTGERDTRVDPLHARKMAALLQSAAKAGRPVLLHDSTVGGHSAGVGLEQQIDDDARQMSFLWTETEVTLDSRH